MKGERPRILVTAPFSGDGLAKLERLGDVVLDPWIDTKPLRILAPDPLAERIVAEGADMLVCEGDFVMGAALDAGLKLIGSTRGDPNNVDVKGATERGIPVLHTPGRNADAVAEMTIALLFAVARHVIPADRDLRAGEAVKDGQVSYQRYRGREKCDAGDQSKLLGVGEVRPTAPDVAAGARLTALLRRGG